MAVRWGQVSRVVLDVVDTPGDGPRYGFLYQVAIDSVDDSPVIGPRYGELENIRLWAITHEVEPFQDRAAKSLEQVAITAVLTDGTQADSWVWRQVSGATVTLAVSGGTCTIGTPATIAGTTVVLGCTGVKQGGNSPEEEIAITVRPHQRWRKIAGGWTPFEGSPQ